MKRIKISIASIVFGLAIITSSCGTETVSTRDAYILTPHKEKPVETIQLALAQDTIIKFTSGTTIEVPKNAFVRKDGGMPIGKLEINFSEYHTFGEIYASGNPMLFKEDDGKLGQMVSAGMIDFTALDSKGNELDLNQNKEVKINLACQSNMEGFDLFYIEEQKAIQYNKSAFLQIATTSESSSDLKVKWKRLKNVTIQKRQSLETDLATIIEPKQPIEPQKNDSNKTYFNINLDTKQFPEFKGYSSLIFTMLEEGNEALLEKSWTNINIQDSGLGYFDMVLNSETDTVKLPVVPVLEGEEFDNALAAFQKNAISFKEKTEEINRQRKAKLNAGAYITSFVANRTGTYNIDMIYHQLNSVQAFEPLFVNNGKAIDVKELLLISSLDGAKSVVNYSNENLDEFFYIGMLNNSILITDVDGVKYAVNSFNFKEQSINFNASNKELKVNKVTEGLSALKSLNNFMFSLDQSL